MQKNNQEDRLLTEEKFNIIKKIQEKVMNQTGFSPNFKTLINEAIDEKFATRTIEKFNRILTEINN